MGNAISSPTNLTIGIVAGEPSGDILAAGLMASLIQQCAESDTTIRFIGIGGPKMAEVGYQSLFPMDAITMMGLEEGLGKVRAILKIRRSLAKQLAQTELDAFVGVDVPDFNLSVEANLKQTGVPTIHYVSPTVWAWRGYRIKKIARAVTRMLTLFPFEQRYYEKRAIPATFVGHSAASQVGSAGDLETARQSLAKSGQVLIGLLPGSRRAEVSKLLQPMLEAAKIIYSHQPQVCFVLPIAKPELTRLVHDQVSQFTGLPITLLDGESSRVLQAADYAIVASGTASLEALLNITPMVVVYKVSRFTEWMFKALGHVKHFAMPNHLLPDPVVPELAQEQVTGENIAQQLENYLQHPVQVANLKRQFEVVAETLKQDSNRLAAQAVLEEIKSGSG